MKSDLTLHSERCNDKGNQSLKLDGFKLPGEVRLKPGRYSLQLAHHFRSKLVIIGIARNTREWMRIINEEHPFIVAEVLTEQQSQNR